MLEVRNVKISLKVKGCCLNIVRKLLDDKGIVYKIHPNFISFLLHNFTYVYFKEPFRNKSINHINITKIPSLDKVDEAIVSLKNICVFEVISQNIDNIIATCTLDRPINIKKVVDTKCFSQTKYNPEQFPGIFITFDGGTVILFHSGNIVLVGFKEIAILEDVYQILCARMKTI
jgi:hypothetical protein